MSGSSITKLEAYIFATGLTLSSMLSVVLHQLYFFYGHRTGMHMRIATTGCIYRKASVDMGSELNICSCSFQPRH